MDAIKIKSHLYDYQVEFCDSFESALTEIKEKVVYVIDKNVYKLYKDRFHDINEESVYLMEAVENRKNMDTVMELIMFFKKNGVRKDWKVLCFGGGITQDVTTVASNLFLRNIDWIFFPTTLLSMCDSCIGGKCGINLGQYKNQIGVFYPPKKIYIDTSFIDTLKEEDYLNGWGELLKFSLTDGTDMYSCLANEERYIPCDHIKFYIHKGLMIKKKIIEEDEFESDLRRVLNYGHTFGHALEAYTHNEIPHGAAVIWGIDVANYLSMKHGFITQDVYLSIKKLIKDHFLKKEIVLKRPWDLFEIIKTDKKVKGDALHFALLDAPTHLMVYGIRIDDKLKEDFLDYIRKTHEYYSD